MAAPTLTPNQLNDLVNTGLKDLGRGRFTEIATDIQEHTALNNLMDKNRVNITGGYAVQWDVMVNHSGSFQNVGLGASDSVSIVDTMVQASADWRNSTANWSIIGQEIDMNREPARIVNLLLVRRQACMISMAEGMESNMWGPPPALADTVTPWGVRTWIVKSATEGFQGGAPSGYTTIGLNPTTYPRWKNWTYQYTSVTKDDLIRHWRKAAYFTNFKPPVPGIPTFNTGNKYGYYTNYAVLGPLEEALEAQNESLGPDIASQDGKVMFRHVPVSGVYFLESDTTNSVYGINWGDFKTYVLQGWWLKETNVPVYPGQHTVSAHFLDCTYQWVAKNRRQCFVLSTGTSEPG